VLINVWLAAKHCLLLPSAPGSAKTIRVDESCVFAPAAETVTAAIRVSIFRVIILLFSTLFRGHSHLALEIPALRQHLTICRRQAGRSRGLVRTEDSAIRRSDLCEVADDWHLNPTAVSPQPNQVAAWVAVATSSWFSSVSGVSRGLLRSHEDNKLEPNPLSLFGLGAKVVGRHHLTKREGSSSTPAAFPIHGYGVMSLLSVASRVINLG
jgi:hypothetical protein